MRITWALTIEALRIMEAERLKVSKSLKKSANQLNVKDETEVVSAGRLLTECLRRRNFIDKIASLALTRSSFKSLKPGVKAFLRLYTYVTKFTAKGDKKAVNLAVVGRRLLGWRELMPVEEALGKIIAINPDTILGEAGEVERVSLKTFNPTWFTQYCYRLLGRSEALKLLGTSRKGFRPFICLNPLKSAEENTLSRLSKQGISLEKVEECPLLYRVVKSRGPLTGLEEHAEGLFFLQSRAGCLTVLADKPRRDSVIFDVGSTHGYKAAYASVLMDGRGSITCLDYPSRRIRVLKGILNRLGLNDVHVLSVDAAEALPFKEEADLIYLTPPSSGSGGFWRTASKWAGFSPVKRAIKLQWKMLNLCTRYLDDGGRLIYSTSSILVEENEALIERFLKWHPEFVLSELDIEDGLRVPGFRGQRESLRLYPHLHNVDGTYIAKLVKLRG